MNVHFYVQSNKYKPVAVEFVVGIVVDVVLLTVVGVGTGVIVVVVVVVDVVGVVVGVVVAVVVVMFVVADVVSVVADDLPTPSGGETVCVIYSTYASVARAYVASKQAEADICGEQLHIEHPDDDSF